MSQQPQILECTLRDGSYALDFQFTKEDTAKIVSKLDELGFSLIEVGHGIGLGASKNGHGQAAASDQEYMNATASNVKKGKWGMFCIPGIADIEDLEIAESFGMNFVRIGCEVSEVDIAIEFIKRAESMGMQVFSNLMKSYTCEPEYFAEQAAKCFDNGADCVYVVDSAGGMLPTELDKYADAIWSRFPDAKLGFHGHNNLGMAVSNSLHCLDRGFSVVDSSLQGLGRSSGNAPTEQLAAAMIRSNYHLSVDIVDVMHAGEQLIRPLINITGIDSLDTVAGMALFHSSYMRRVLDTSKNLNIDPRRLIIELCEHDKTNAAQELVDNCAKTVLKRHGKMQLFSTRTYYGEEQK
jgi:4-hydroxy 2-oxovalerate aldolase